MDAGGLPVTGYRIEVAEDVSTSWTDVEADTGTTVATYEHTGLTGGTTYRYRVSAVSAAGPGAASDAASATTAEDVACGRSEGVREAIVAEAGVESCGKVTAAHVVGITELEVDFEPLVLKAGDFEGLTSLTALRLDGNQLSALPPGVFAGLTSLTALRLDGNELSALPPGIFTGLTGLTTLDLRDNPNSPLPVTVFLEKEGEDGIKAVASTGAPFGLTVEVGVENGETAGGESEVELSLAAGAVESGAVTVLRTAGTTGAVTAAIVGFSSLPANHDGYELTAGGELEVLAELPVVGITAGASPVMEGTDRHAVFGLTRTGATAEALTVTVTVGQTGAFIAVSGPTTVRFGVGEAEAALNVAIVDDEVKEFAGGSVTATLAAAGSYALGADTSAEVRVLDDDARVRVSWAESTVTVVEGEGPAAVDSGGGDGGGGRSAGGVRGGGNGGGGHGRGGRGLHGDDGCGDVRARGLHGRSGAKGLDRDDRGRCGARGGGDVRVEAVGGGERAGGIRESGGGGDGGGRRSRGGMGVVHRAGGGRGGRDRGGVGGEQQRVGVCGGADGDADLWGHGGGRDGLHGGLHERDAWGGGEPERDGDAGDGGRRG